MKSFYYTGLCLILMVSIFGCGDNSGNNQAQSAAPVGDMSCQGSCQMPGYVQTSAGCLPQGNCSPCMGSSNGACMPSVATNGYSGSYPAYGANPTMPPPTNYPYGGGYQYGGYYPGYMQQPTYYPGNSWYFYYGH